MSGHFPLKPLRPKDCHSSAKDTSRHAPVDKTPGQGSYPKDPAHPSYLEESIATEATPSEASNIALFDKVEIITTISDDAKWAEFVFHEHNEGDTRCGNGSNESLLVSSRQATERATSSSENRPPDEHGATQRSQGRSIEFASWYGSRPAQHPNFPKSPSRKDLRGGAIPEKLSTKTSNHVSLLPPLASQATSTMPFAPRSALVANSMEPRGRRRLRSGIGNEPQDL